MSLVALPAVYEGHAMFRDGRGALAISGAAMGSLLGAFVVLGLVYLVSPMFISCLSFQFFCTGCSLMLNSFITTFNQ